MKFPKFVNKKMIIFVILIIAFIYFFSSLNIIREGINTPDSSNRRSRPTETVVITRVPVTPINES